MNLIDRYVGEVGRHLPEKDRSDIEAEIRSMVEDMLEERGHPPKTADEKVLTEILEQLGDPKLLAQKYAPAKRYLIGPDWYEAYVETLKRILATALPVVATATVFVALARGSFEFGDVFEQVMGRVIDVAIGILFWVTVAFILVEHSDTNPSELGSRKPGSWTVAQLPKFPRKRQISIAETLASIVFILGFTGWMVLPFVQSQGNESVPVLNPDLWQLWLPFFLVLIVLTLIHEVFKLIIGNWTSALMITNVILCLLSIAYIIALVTTQEVFNPAFLATLREGVPPTDLPNVTSWARWTINITTTIIIGVYVWDIINSIVMAQRLNKPESINPFAAETVAVRRMK
jgi:hypothetical protein